MEKSLVIIYTQNIRGDLALLPRLYTFIQQLQKEHEDERVLVDLGASCSDDIWHCRVTEGRSALLVLDAMGYQVVNVELSQASRDRLRGQVMLALVDDEHQHEQDGLLFTTKAVDAAMETQIVITAAEKTAFENNTLKLQAIDRGQIGIVRLDGDTIQHEVRAMPTDTLPDQIIIGVVDLVLGEVRHFKKRSE
jgi:hypothetical protein